MRNSNVVNVVGDGGWFSESGRENFAQLPVDHFLFHGVFHGEGKGERPGRVTGHPKCSS